MKTDKRKEDQRLASQALRDKKAAATDRLTQIADKLEASVDKLDEYINNKNAR